jgi:acyl-CoA thioester hydrolase
VPRVKVELPERLPFSTEIPVQISDINYGGHLGNDALLALLQEARIRYLKGGGMSELDAGGCGIIMVDAMIQYRAEVFYGDVLMIDIGVGDTALSGCDILYRVTRKQDGQEVARAKTGIAFFDYARRKVVPMPERFRKFAEQS